MKSIFVGNISNSTTEPRLRELFEAHGVVERVSILTDRATGKSRGFAFVEMTDVEEADHAIAGLNGTTLDGRALRVNAAQPKAGRRPRPGGGAGGAHDDYRGHARQPREPRW